MYAERRRRRRCSGVAVQLVVLVNKMDEASVKWSKARFEEIQEKLGPFLKLTGHAAVACSDT